MRRKLKILSLILTFIFLLCGCTNIKESNDSGKYRSPEWSKNTTIYEVNVRQYTKEGTFKAFEENLPRLKEMGVETLWLMPINPISKTNRKGSLGSYYAVDDYKAINPEFGTLEDFKELVKKSHEMGFKVLIDWVANHTGYDHKWITEHKDWYIQDSKGNIKAPIGTDWTDVAGLNYKNMDMRKEMINSMSYWVKECDIDGFRCDHAEGCPVDFWENAKNEIEKIKPIYMLAEDEKNLSFMNKAFNSNYGWTLFHTMNSVALGKDSVNSLKSAVDKINMTYPSGAYPLLFTSNHDENSWNGTEYERMGDNVKTMTVLTFTLPGVPLIYSGQEFSLNRRLKFFDKDIIEQKESDMSDLYKKLIAIRKENKALWNYDEDKNITFLDTGNKDVMAFSREKDKNKVIVVVNISKKDNKININLEKLKGSYKDAISDDKINFKENQEFNVGANEFKIYVNN